MNAVSRHWEVVRTALAEEKIRARGLVQTHEVSFLPAAMEIVERPVSPTARASAWTLLVAFVLTILWLTLGRVDVVASAGGKLMPASNVKLIQSAEPGIVRAILVREGQKVKAGELLVELDPTVSNADVAQSRKALEAAMLDVERLRAVLSALDGRGLTFNPPPSTPADVAATQFALAGAQLADIQAGGEVRGAGSRIALAARAEAEIQAEKLAETLPLLDEQIEANEKLLAKGYVSKLKVIEMRRQRLATARDRDAAVAALVRANAQIEAARGSSTQSAAEARVQVLADLAKANLEVRQRREEVTKAALRSRLQRLRSPVDGTVAQLAIHTLGGVVEAAKPIMVIVPSGGRLIAEVKVLNRDSGFVHPGQPVALKLEAFPFTRYGTVPGQVVSVSSDAVEDEKLGLVYTTRVALNGRTGRGDGKSMPLAAGMSATADIRTGQRTIASYLLSPIDEARLEAGRER